MTTSRGEDHAARRDLWLCLARALAPPAAGRFLDAFQTDLPRDLDAIAGEIGLEIRTEIDAFTAAARRLPDALELQRVYARLFVTPPVPVFMNTGIYLDGAFLGPSELDINGWYARHGFERHPEFRDLNDHAAVQLEFVAILYEKAMQSVLAGDDMQGLAYATEAERFLVAYPRRWATAFLAGLERATLELGLNGAYTHLARILWHAIEQQTRTSAAHLEAAPAATFPEGSNRGMGPLTAEDLAEIAFRLEAAGLGYAHVKALPEWRDDAFAQRKGGAAAAPAPHPG